jgi:hypothetical protein
LGWTIAFCGCGCASLYKSLLLSNISEYGQSINPISRLIQIQQAKKEKEPVYTLIAEKGMPRRREFVMQVFAFVFCGDQGDQILCEKWPGANRA